MLEIYHSICEIDANLLSRRISHGSSLMTKRNARTEKLNKKAYTIQIVIKTHGVA